MDRLPARGPAARPPERMPLLRRGRLLKNWRYVGVYTAELMLCVGDACIGPLPQRWWAVATPDGALHERTSLGTAGLRLGGPRAPGDSRGAKIEPELGGSDG